MIALQSRNLKLGFAYKRGCLFTRLQVEYFTIIFLEVHEQELSVLIRPCLCCNGIITKMIRGSRNGHGNTLA
jgi:hypothetical protein